MCDTLEEQEDEVKQVSSGGEQVNRWMKWTDGESEGEHKGNLAQEKKKTRNSSSSFYADLFLICSVACESAVHSRPNLTAGEAQINSEFVQIPGARRTICNHGMQAEKPRRRERAGLLKVTPVRAPLLAAFGLSLGPLLAVRQIVLAWKSGPCFSVPL